MPQEGEESSADGGLSPPPQRGGGGGGRAKVTSGGVSSARRKPEDSCPNVEIVGGTRQENSLVTPVSPRQSPKEIRGDSESHSDDECDLISVSIGRSDNVLSFGNSPAPQSSRRTKRKPMKRMKHVFNVAVGRVSAKDLPKKDLFGKCTAYMVFKFGDVETFQTTPLKNEYSPSWPDFEHQFLYETEYEWDEKAVSRISSHGSARDLSMMEKPNRLDYLLNTLASNSLNIECWHHHTLRADEMIGSVKVDLRTIATGPQDHNLTIRDIFGNPSGMVAFSVTVQSQSAAQIKMSDVSVDFDRDCDLDANDRNMRLCVSLFSTNDVDGRREADSSDTSSIQSNTVFHSSSPYWSVLPTLRFRGMMKSLLQQELHFELQAISSSTRTYHPVGSAHLPLTDVISARENAPFAFSLALRSSSFSEIAEESSPVFRLTAKISFDRLPLPVQMEGGLHSDEGISGASLLFSGLPVPLACKIGLLACTKDRRGLSDVESQEERLEKSVPSSIRERMRDQLKKVMMVQSESEMTTVLEAILAMLVDPVSKAAFRIEGGIDCVVQLLKEPNAPSSPTVAKQSADLMGENLLPTIRPFRSQVLSRVLLRALESNSLNQDCFRRAHGMRPVSEWLALEEDISVQLNLTKTFLVLATRDSAAQTEISACGGTASLLSLLQRLMATSDVTFNQDMRKGGKAECDEELCSTSGGTGEELLSAICHIFSALVYCEEMNESGTAILNSQMLLRGDVVSSLIRLLSHPSLFRSNIVCDAAMNVFECFPSDSSTEGTLAYALISLLENESVEEHAVNWLLQLLLKWLMDDSRSHRLLLNIVIDRKKLLLNNLYFTSRRGITLSVLMEVIRQAPECLHNMLSSVKMATLFDQDCSYAVEVLERVADKYPEQPEILVLLQPLLKLFDREDVPDVFRRLKALLSRLMESSPSNRCTVILMFLPSLTEDKEHTAKGIFSILSFLDALFAKYEDEFAADNSFIQSEYLQQVTQLYMRGTCEGAEEQCLVSIREGAKGGVNCDGILSSAAPSCLSAKGEQRSRALLLLSSVAEQVPSHPLLRQIIASLLGSMFKDCSASLSEDGNEIYMVASLMGAVAMAGVCRNDMLDHAARLLLPVEHLSASESDAVHKKQLLAISLLQHIAVNDNSATLGLSSSLMADCGPQLLALAFNDSEITGKPALQCLQSLLLKFVDCRHYFLPALSQFVGDIISTHSSDLEEGNKLDDNSEDRILRALQLVLNLAKRKADHAMYDFTACLVGQLNFLREQRRVVSMIFQLVEKLLAYDEGFDLVLPAFFPVLMSDDNAAITHVIRLVLRAIHRPSSSSNNSVPQFEDVKKNRMIEKKEAEEAGESTMMVPIPREPSFAALPSQAAAGDAAEASSSSSAATEPANTVNSSLRFQRVVRAIDLLGVGVLIHLLSQQLMVDENEVTEEDTLKSCLVRLLNVLRESDALGEDGSNVATFSSSLMHPLYGIDPYTRIMRLFAAKIGVEEGAARLLKWEWLEMTLSVMQNGVRHDQMFVEELHRQGMLRDLAPFAVWEEGEASIVIQTRTIHIIAAILSKASYPTLQDLKTISTSGVLAMISDDSLRKQAAGCALMEQFIVSTERRHEFYESRGFSRLSAILQDCLLSPSHSRAALHALRLMIRSSRANLRIEMLECGLIEDALKLMVLDPPADVLMNLLGFLYFMSDVAEARDEIIDSPQSDLIPQLIDTRLKGGGMSLYKSETMVVLKHAALNCYTKLGGIMEKCTISIYGDSFKKQRYYRCRTCALTDGHGCCEACANVCHRGHDLSTELYGDFYCDCGNSSHCMIRQWPSLRAQPPLKLCSYAFTGDNFRTQEWWRCLTCWGDGKFGICRTCVEQCHSGHDTRPGKVSKFFCDCSKRYGVLSCRCLTQSEPPPNSKPRRRQREATTTSEKAEADEHSSRPINMSMGEDDTCVICMDNPKEALLYKCGHVATCEECACMLKQRKQGCPICRMAILEVIRAYRV